MSRSVSFGGKVGAPLAVLLYLLLLAVLLYLLLLAVLLYLLLLAVLLYLLLPAIVTARVVSSQCRKSLCEADGLLG